MKKKINDIDEVNQLLNQKIKQVKKITKNKKVVNEKLLFDKKNIKEFIEKWNEGYTTFEIVDKFKKVSVELDKAKKNTFKL